MSLYIQNRKFSVRNFETELELEKRVFDSASSLFGSDTVLIRAKQRLKAGELGASIPDGLLFDFSDSQNPKFYIVEIELAKHRFYDHIFPQVTKFFGFLRNGNRKTELIDKLFVLINNDPALRARFKKYLGKRELFKSLKDIIENSRDILLIIDRDKPEFREIKETYTDTWDKYVRVMVLTEYQNGQNSVLSLSPDFEAVRNEVEEVGDADESDVSESGVYTEEYHLEDVDKSIKDIYFAIRGRFKKYFFNPQRYYISIKNNGNFAYISLRRKRIRLVVMYPVKRVKLILKHHAFKEPADGVQRFYNGQCTEIVIDSSKHLEEVLRTIKLAAEHKRLKLR